MKRHLTRVGADWANLGAFRLLYALSVGVVTDALARTRPAAQPWPFGRQTEKRNQEVA